MSCFWLLSQFSLGIFDCLFDFGFLDILCEFSRMDLQPSTAPIKGLVELLDKVQKDLSCFGNPIGLSPDKKILLMDQPLIYITNKSFSILTRSPCDPRLMNVPVA